MILGAIQLWETISDERVLSALVIVSIVTFVATLIIVPFMIIRLPEDYFVRDERIETLLHKRHPMIRLALMIGKNLLGGVLVVGGLAMLVMPGQGVLSILIGLSLIDFPGKFWLERKIVCRKPVHRAINWIRRRGGASPMVIPDCV